jgi:hypothetical protein
MTSWRMRFGVMAVVVAGLASPVGAATGPRCEAVSIPVAVAPGQPATFRVVGTWCTAGDPAGRSVQILVHGFSLSPVYFDPPYRPERYSYVRAATAAGYTVLNLARLGVGRSDHPPAMELTTDHHAYMLHQVVDAVVVTAFLHPGFDVPHSSLFVAASLPAQLDPAFSSAGLPPG